MVPFEAIRSRREALNLSQLELAQRASRLGMTVTQQTVDRIERGETKHSRFLPQVLAVLGLDPEGNVSDAQLTSPNNRNHRAGFTHLPRRLIDPSKPVPVHAAAEGGAEGALIVDVLPFEWAPRPGSLEGDPDAYMILITGDSMRPRYRPGERALVSPIRPPMPGEDHIFRSEEQHGEWRAMVKELVRITPAHWTVTQYNPAKTLKLDRKIWQVCHRIVGRADRA